MKKLIILLAVFLMAFTPLKKRERDYQKEFCVNGIMEYTLEDGSRVDCLTTEFAIELDFAKKWAECCGQALFYSEKTNKKPACALIVGKDDDRFLKRLETVANAYDIKIFIIEK